MKNITTVTLSPEILCRAGDIVIEKRRFGIEMLQRSDLHLPYREAEEVGRQLRLWGIAGGSSLTGTFDVALAPEAWSTIRTKIMAGESPVATIDTPVAQPCLADSLAGNAEVPASRSPE